MSIKVFFFLTIAATVAFFEHDSSQVALLGSGFVVLLAWKWRAIVIRTLAVLWCAAFVLVLPANFAAFESGLHYAGAFAWGMWQSWFMCAAALLPIYLRIAAVGASSDDRTARPMDQLNDAGR